MHFHMSIGTTESHNSACHGTQMVVNDTLMLVTLHFEAGSLVDSWAP